MFNKIQFLCLIAVLLGVFSCKTATQNEEELKVINNQGLVRQANPEQDELLNILRASGINELALNKEGKTWQDIDAFYKQLPNRYTNPKHLMAVQRKTINTILDNYNLIAEVQNNLPTIEFYIQEMQKTKAGYPSLYTKIITNLRKSSWAQGEVEKLKESFITKLNAQNKDLEAKIKQQKDALTDEKLSSADKKTLQISIDYLENHLQVAQKLKDA